MSIVARVMIWLFATGFAVAPSVAQVQFVAQDNPGQWLVSDLIGVDVFRPHPDNELVGDIRDLWVGRNGMVNSVVIDVGSYIGGSEKNIAIPFNQIQIAQNPDRAVISMTKDQLRAAPDFNPATLASSNYLRGSRLYGVGVYNLSNELIGEINDLLMRWNGAIEAIILEVGGGIGGASARDVAIPFSYFQTWDQNRATINVTRNQIGEAPAFIPTADRSTDSIVVNSKVNPVMQPKQPLHTAQECANDMVCRGLIDAVAVYFGSQPGVVSAALAAVPMARKAGEEGHFAIRLPSGYEYCRSTVRMHSVVPRSGARASVISASVRKTGVDVYTWTPKRPTGGPRSWVEADFIILGVREAVADKHRTAGICRSHDRELLACRGDCSSVTD